MGIIMNLQRVAVFVDVLNLFYSAKYMHQSKVDYGRLLAGILGERQLTKATAYVIQKFDANQKPFYDMLKQTGYEVKVKELKDRLNGRSKEHHETWVSQMTIDAMESIENVDTIILVTGDCEYTDLVAHLKSKNINVEVVGVDKTIDNKLASSASAVFGIKEEWMFKERKFEPKKVETAPVFRSAAPTQQKPNYDEVQPDVPNQPTARLFV